MTATERLIRAAEKVPAVAFDVFDTLICRDTAAPTGLFVLCGQDETFAERRVQAEREVRALHQKEVTLKEIYSRPCLRRENVDMELSAELAAAVPNGPVVAAARACKNAGKAVYAISDMYLPAEQVRNLLEKCGVDFLDGVYVSSEYGVQKRSGKLFRVFLQDTGLRPDQVLFVGDDRRADGVGARLAGIRWMPAPRKASLPVRMNDQAKGNLTAFVQNRLPEAEEPVFFQTLGPLAAGFACWLHCKRNQNPSGRLLFMARDMELIHKVYGLFWPEDRNVGYLRVSRRSLCPALLAAGRFDLVVDALPRQSLTTGQIARYCGADVPRGIVQTFDLKRQEEREEVQSFLRSLDVDPDAVCRTQQYLKQQGVMEGSILVDIGSGGTIQRLLESLCEAPLHGLYLACDERLDQKRADVFLFQAKPAPLDYWMGQPILEKLLSEPCGPTLGYRDQEGEIVPICGKAHAERSVRQARQEVLRFAEEWKKSILWKTGGRELVPDRVILPFLQMMRSPSLSEIRLFEKLTVEDGGSWPVIPRPRRSRYLFHPASFVEDLRNARWKIGFMRRCFLIPLPYARLYAAWKKREGA